MIKVKRIDHVAVAVADRDAGARGHLVAFLHPAATGGVLFELCEPAPSHTGSVA
jgi:hypothetical protein